MPNFVFKHKKFILSLLLIFLVSSLGLFVFGVGEARAVWPFGALVDIAFGGVVHIIASIGVIFKSIASLFFWLAAMVLEMAFGLEKFTDAEVVKIGWGITRDVANMLFVVGLLIIAGATALNIEAYGIKKLLPKLIIAALLINFSLVMAGVIIDFTQVLTHFFYDEINTGSGIGAQIAQMTKISELPKLNPDASAGEALAAGISGSIMMIFSTFLEVMFILAASIALAIGAFFLIVRMITLWILLILAPLAWLMWILPATSHLFQKWWNDFFKWSFFAPIYAFFIYIAIKAYTSGVFPSIVNDEMEGIVNKAGFGETLASAFLAVPNSFMQFLVIVGLLFGGLIVAQKMGVYGAAGAISIAKSAQKGAGNWAKRKAQRATARPAGAIGRGLSDIGTRMGWVGRVTGAKALTRQAGRGFRSLEEKERAAIGAEGKKYENYTDNNLKSTYKAVDARGKVAIAKILAKRGKLKEEKGDKELGFANEDIEKVIGTAKKYGQEKDLLKVRPDLAVSEKQAEENKEEAKDKIKTSFSFKPEDLANLQKESYTGDGNRQKIVREVLKDSITKPRGKMKSSHLSKLTETNPELHIHIQKIIQEDIAPKDKIEQVRQDRPDIVEFLESDAAKALYEQTIQKEKEESKKKK